MKGNSRGVKLAASSTSFDQALQSGDLTQLEFLDRAASSLRADGVVLDIRHFPRTDDEYCAQIKKMAADSGLTIAALASDTFFSSDSAMEALLAIAGTIGAPLLTGRLSSETAIPWSKQLEFLGMATSLAKKANVTLAVRNAAGTFAATASDCKRVSKESDSAWLRFGFEPAAFDAASDARAHAEKAVLLWASTPGDLAESWWEDYRGFVVVQGQEMHIAMRSWRTAIANFELNRK